LEPVGGGKAFDDGGDEDGRDDEDGGDDDGRDGGRDVRLGPREALKLSIAVWVAASAKKQKRVNRRSERLGELFWRKFGNLGFS
jgi:hypothetical protein